MEDLISQENSHVENKFDQYYFNGSLNRGNKYMDIIDSDEDNQSPNHKDSFQEHIDDGFKKINYDDDKKQKPKKNDTSTITSTTMNHE